MPVVIIKNQKSLTISLEVTRIFEKRHKNILRDTEKLDVSDGFILLNFEHIFCKEVTQ